jgi:hypothetical protein
MEAPMVTPRASVLLFVLLVTAPTIDRPISADCETSFTFLQGPPSACSVFEPTPSAFIAISGTCQISHLGRTQLDAVQQLIFLLDASGQPVLVNGQPVVTELRNCSTLTAANGDQLHHTSAGDVAPAEPGEVTFDGTILITGGTGRFSSASGVASFSGSASLITNTGQFTFTGTVTY